MNSLQTRRFGTDVSNIPVDKLTGAKTPKKNLTINTNKTPKKVEIDLKVDEIAERIPLNLKFEDAPSSNIVQNTSTIPFRYEKDFLLSFKELAICNEKIEGLIEEVTPGYRPPYVPEDISMEVNFTRRKSASAVRPTHRKTSSLSGIDIPFDGFSTPSGGAVFFKLDMDTKPEKLDLDAPCSPPVNRTERAIKFSKSAPVTPISSLLAMADPFGDIQPIAPLNLNLEWRVKKTPKKVKPRETDIRRLAARQKQIDIGMNTPGYQRFCELVPMDKRTKEHPRIPDIHQVCSKRSWDGQVRKWRRMLHDYDPESGTREDQEDEDLGSDEEEDDDVAISHCSNVARDEEESSHSIVETQ